MRDFITAARSLRKNIGFTCAVVAMLAVGIGATTAMFSIADGVLFAPLPYAHERRLVAITNHGTRRGNTMSLPDLLDVRHGVKSLDEVGAVFAGPGLLTGEGDPLEVGKGVVSANWFSMLGVQPVIGRFFVPGEDDTGAAKVVVINEELWRTRFGADRGVLGRAIMVDGESRVVIGVASRRTSFPYKLGTWTPITMSPGMVMPARRGNRYYQVAARVAEGASFSQARAEFKTFTARLHEAYPVPETGLDYDLMPLREQVVGDAKPALLVMVAAVSFILLIACANVAGLLLLRARQRSQEMGIRLALGASPRRVVREMLAESLVYGAIGGALGVVLAESAVRGIVAMRPAYLPFIDDIAVDWRVLAFAIVVTLVTAVVFGIAPALLASKTDLVAALTSATRSSSAGKRSSTLRQAFVVLELALALVLLVGAGLLGKSFERLMAIDTGFQPAGLMHFDMGPPSYPPPANAKTAADSSAQSRAAIDAYLNDLRAVPGTKMVAAGFGAPFTGPAVNQRGVHIEGDAPDVEDRPTLASWKSVTPGYLETLGVPLVHGRYFTERDRAGAARVAIVNEAFVNAYLGGRDPIGEEHREGRRDRRRGWRYEESVAHRGAGSGIVHAVRSGARRISHGAGSIVRVARVGLCDREKTIGLHRQEPADIRRRNVRRSGSLDCEPVGAVVGTRRGILSVRAAALCGGDLQRRRVRGAGAAAGVRNSRCARRAAAADHAARALACAAARRDGTRHWVGRCACNKFGAAVDAVRSGRD